MAHTIRYAGNDVKIVSQNREAHNSKAVILCCDSAVLPYAAFTASQLSKISRSSNFDVVIVSLESLDLGSIDDLDGVRLCQIDVGNIFENQHQSGRFGFSAYLRWSLPKIFGVSYSRILYMDCDIFIAGGDIERLLGVDIGKNPVAAVKDLKQWKNPSLLAHEFERLGWDFAPYFNSGVLLIDSNSFIENDIMENCIDFGARHRGKFMTHDQGILNCILRNSWSELSPVWNWQSAAYFPNLGRLATPNFYHFVSQSKPWSSNQSGNIPPWIVDGYKEFLLRYFPDLPPITYAKKGFWKSGKGKLRRLRTETMMVPRMIRYLNRFSSDFDVKNG
ncbi:MAG: hypothetical protein DI533_20970 [Cereibacter sphaeroides]|uniref:Glycosyltransferase family 8 protein n=1 Tax=Cereibacter sphaeroides TaxID=1063 RepID=A0A2W5RYG9_CERSP|nr:MAG: hypothetical protein DI533_20970 [Cereibacter sphaeroides]